MAVDASSIDIKHVRLNDDGNYDKTMNSHLNDVLTKEANIDQTGRAMIRDVVYSMLDEGCIALVPTILTEDPNVTESYEVLEARVGKVVEWYPQEVRVEVYNETTGKKEEVVVDKRYTQLLRTHSILS